MKEERTLKRASPNNYPKVESIFSEGVLSSLWGKIQVDIGAELKNSCQLKKLLFINLVELRKINVEGGKNKGKDYNISYDILKIMNEFEKVEKALKAKGLNEKTLERICIFAADILR